MGKTVDVGPYKFTKKQVKPVKRAIRRKAEAKRQVRSGRRPSPGARVYAKREAARGRPITNKTGKRLKAKRRQRVRERELAQVYLSRRRLSPNLGKGPVKPNKPTVSNRKELHRFKKSASKSDPRGNVTKAKSFVASGGLGKLANAPETLGLALAKAYYDEPLGTLKKDAKYVSDSVTGIPHIPGALLTPKKTGKAIWEDVKDRYEPVVKGDAKGAAKKIKETGGLPYAVDTVPAGMVVGKATGAAAKTGVLGTGAKKVVTEPRKKLRVAPGVVRKQKDETRKAAPNLAVAYAQKRRDSKRQRKYAKRVRKAAESGRATKPLLRPLALDEVVPRTKTRARVLVAKDIARSKGKAIVAMKREQHDAIKVNRKALKKLSKPERRALAYAQQGLVIADNPASSVRLLKRRKAQILANREGKHQPTRFEADEVKDIDYLIKHADEVFTPKLKAARDTTRKIDIETARTNPALDVRQRLMARRGPQGELLGMFEGGPTRTVDIYDSRATAKALKRRGVTAKLKPATELREETAAEFVRRIREQAQRRGLDDPGYFPHTLRRDAPNYADYAVGGTHAVQGYKQRTGSAFREGRIDTSVEKMDDALARGIKIKHNWKLVSDQIERHADPKYRGDFGTVALRLQADGIDPSDVAVIFPRKLREGMEQGRKAGDTADIEPIKGVERAFENASVLPADADELAALGKKYAGTRDAVVVSRQAYKSIMDSAHPSNVGGRVMDILQSKQSRALLGTLNVPWVAVDAISGMAMNAAQGIMPAGKHFWASQKWWHDLKKADPKAFRYLEGEIGVHPRMTDIYQPKLGATADNYFVNGWRAWKRMKFHPAKSTVDAFLMLEQKVAVEPFRKAAAYKALKSRAFEKIAEDAGHMQAAVARVQSLFGKPPKEQIAKLLKSRTELESVARTADSFLGNWISFTRVERRVFARTLMFYPFLRYSIRLAVYTMPADHPVMTAIGSKIANLETEEQRELLGGDPPKGLGRHYGKSGETELRLFERANPLLNALFSVEKSSELYGVLPPVLTALAGQLSKSDLYTGQPWQVGGTSGEAGAPKSDYSKLPAEEKAWIRTRVFANQLLSLPLPTRELTYLTQKGKQGDDTLPFSPRPIKYKQGKSIARNQKMINRRNQYSTRDQFLQDLGFKYRPSTVKEQIAKEKGTTGAFGSGYDWSKVDIGPQTKGSYDWSKVVLK